MKVLHVTSGYLPEGTGGIESYLRELLKAQRTQGIVTTLVTGSQTPWPECGVEDLVVEGERVLRVHRDDWFFELHAKSWHPTIGRIFEGILARERPDLVHVHQWLRLTSDLIEIADRAGVPAVVTLHDLYVSCPRCFRVRRGDEACFRELSDKSCHDCVPRFGHESEREIKEGIELFREQYAGELALARRIVTATATTADLVASKTGLPRDRLAILPLGYERRFSKSPPRPAPLPRQGEPLRIGYWGNLTRRKGAHVLVAAFRELCERTKAPLELHLFGKIDTDELAAELHRLAAGRPVTFHGRYSYEQLASAGLHLAAFPTVCFETFGFVLDECFELSLPCVVTDIGALPERAGRAALVVPPNDVAALAEALLRVVMRPALCDEMRAAIPALAPLPHDHAQQLLAVYEQALATKRSAGVATIPWSRRAAFLLMQRESAQQRASPGGPS